MSKAKRPKYNPKYIRPALREKLSLVASKIEIALWQNEFDRIDRLLDEAKEIWHDEENDVDPGLNDPVAILDLPTRICNAFENTGIQTVGDVLKTPYVKLISLVGIGPKNFNELQEKLRENGYEHGMTPQRIRQLQQTGFRL